MAGDRALVVLLVKRSNLVRVGYSMRGSSTSTCCMALDPLLPFTGTCGWAILYAEQRLPLDAGCAGCTYAKEETCTNGDGSAAGACTALHPQWRSCSYMVMLMALMCDVLCVLLHIASCLTCSTYQERSGANMQCPNVKLRGDQTSGRSQVELSPFYFRFWGCRCSPGFTAEYEDVASGNDSGGVGGKATGPVRVLRCVQAPDEVSGLLWSVLMRDGRLGRCTLLPTMGCKRFGCTADVRQCSSTVMPMNFLCSTSQMFKHT